MPARTAKQQRFMGAEKARREEGKKPRIPSMTDAAVDDYAHKPTKGYSKSKKRGY